VWRTKEIYGKKDLQMQLNVKTAFENQINFKNATTFFTNAFKRKATLNKEHSFLHFALVIVLVNIIIHSVYFDFNSMAKEKRRYMQQRSNTLTNLS